MQSKISIRPITVEDADEIEELYNQSAEHLRSLGDDSAFQFGAQIYRRDGFGEHPAFAGFCAVLDKKLVGYLLYTVAYDTDQAMRYVFVIDLLVDTRFRKRGIGKALMEHAGTWCREVEGQELFWAVYNKNELAINFYNHLGAEEITDLRFMRLKM
ncbi:MAG: GNAT family N-acetyltransferase [bacterium]|nr:GNAT family N-acetyltransferase [bacterium]